MVRSFLFSRLLGLPSLSPKARQALALEADARAYRGMVLAAEGSAEAMQAESLDERAAIARKLREGSDLYASGAAGKSALEGETSGPAVATNWFPRSFRSEPSCRVSTPPIRLGFRRPICS